MDALLRQKSTSDKFCRGKKVQRCREEYLLAILHCGVYSRSAQGDFHVQIFCRCGRCCVVRVYCNRPRYTLSRKLPYSNDSDQRHKHFRWRTRTSGCPSARLRRYGVARSTRHGIIRTSEYSARIERWAVIDAPLPGIGDWDNIIRSPLLWHFNF